MRRNGWGSVRGVIIDRIACFQLGESAPHRASGRGRRRGGADCGGVRLAFGAMFLIIL